MAKSRKTVILYTSREVKYVRLQEIHIQVLEVLVSIFLKQTLKNLKEKFLFEYDSLLKNVLIQFM